MFTVFFFKTILNVIGDYGAQAITIKMNATGTLNIGKKGGGMNKNSPNIYVEGGQSHIVYGSSSIEVNFYDGIIKGKNSSVYYGTFDDVPDGTQLIKDTETIDDQTYYVAYLNNLNNFLQVGTKEFNSINKAVKEIVKNYKNNDIQQYIDMAQYAKRSTYKEYKLLVDNVVTLAYKRELGRFSGDIKKQCVKLKKIY